MNDMTTRNRNESIEIERDSHSLRMKNHQFILYPNDINVDAPKRVNVNINKF